MKHLFSALLGVAAVCAATRAHADVPGTVAFTGRLSDSNGLVSGTTGLVFELFDAPTGGNQVWSENHSIAAENGLVYARLGSTNALDETIFDGLGDLYLQITVNGETLAPRLEMQSVPYAILAGSAEKLGQIPATEVVTTVNGGPGVEVMRTMNTVNVGLTTCASGQVLKSNGSGYACAADANTTYSAGPGLALNGTAFGLTTCAAGQILKAGAGGTWACAADTDTNTTYTAAANSGIALNGTAFGLTTCSAGQVLKAGAGGTWACGTDTSYTATTGIAINGLNQIGIDSSIVPRKDSAAGNQTFDGGTLHLDYANNRIGVGTTAPSATLHVNGEARATSYTYPTPQTGTFFIPGPLLVPNTGDESWGINTGGFGYISAGASPYTGTAMGVVSVPDGVTITSAFCSYGDLSSSASLSIAVNLYRRGLTSQGVGTLGTASASTTDAETSTSVHEVTATSIFPAVVDNSTFTYLIAANLAVSSPTSALRLYGCGVKYTYTRVSN